MRNGSGGAMEKDGKSVQSGKRKISIIVQTELKSEKYDQTKNTTRNNRGQEGADK